MPPLPEPARLGALFKAYDVRGTVPDQLDEDLAHRIGSAFVAVLDAPAVVLGHDMRASSPGLAEAFAEGARLGGADVTTIGLASTDQLYFASGRAGLAGAMITASHNPAGDNGIKMCHPGARPVGWETGLRDIRDQVASGPPRRSERPGTRSEQDVLAAYADHLLSLAPVSGRRLRVVVDAGNGMAGLTAPAVLGRLGTVEMVPMYLELDGSFPHHEANPIDPATLVDLQRRVRQEQADLGLAFDGDADRCFLVDERGELVSPSALTSLIAERELQREPGAAVIHNLITSRAVPELVAARGGRPIRTRVGHSFIKATMAQENAVFGGEHSGHFYFRDFWFADSGMLAALHALAALAQADVPLSRLMADYTPYSASGEINSTVTERGPALAALTERFAGPDVVLDHLDGTTFTHDDWWLNVRPSNTEPLLRLNVEGRDTATMERLRDEALTIIRSHP